MILFPLLGEGQAALLFNGNGKTFFETIKNFSQYSKILQPQVRPTKIYATVSSFLTSYYFKSHYSRVCRILFKEFQKVYFTETPIFEFWA